MIQIRGVPKVDVHGQRAKRAGHPAYPVYRRAIRWGKTSDHRSQELKSLNVLRQNAPGSMEDGEEMLVTHVQASVVMGDVR